LVAPVARGEAAMNAPIDRARWLALALLLGSLQAVPALAQPAPEAELGAVLRALLVSDGSRPGGLLSWDAGPHAIPGVAWTTDGPREANQAHGADVPYERTGRVALVDGSEPLYRDPGSGAPGAWRVALRGPRAGVIRAELVSEGDAVSMDIVVPDHLRAAGWEVEPFRCDRARSPAIFGRVVHRVSAPGARMAWLEESWDYGTLTGMRIALVLHHREEDAAAVECVER
jgi:hypothetical protein